MQREVGLDFADKRIMAVLAIILKQPQELVVAHDALKYAKGNKLLRQAHKQNSIHRNQSVKNLCRIFVTVKE